MIVLAAIEITIGLVAFGLLLLGLLFADDERMVVHVAALLASSVMLAVAGLVLLEIAGVIGNTP